MERVAFDVDGVHLGIGNLDALGITAGVDVASDGEASIGGGADQLDDDLMADERLAAPVLRNVGEQAMLDPVPFAGAGRQVGHRHGEAGFIGEALQFAFPQADPGAVAAAAVGGDDEAAGFGIARATEPLPPAADALDGEGGGIGVDADIDPALVGGDVVDAIGGNLAQLRDLEVVDADRFGIAPGAQLPARVLEVADQLLLLSVDRDGRFARRDRRLDRGVNVLELGIAVRMTGSLAGLAVGLTTVLQVAQQPADQFLADLEPLAPQRLGDVALAAADSAQGRFRVAPDRILDQGLKGREQPRPSFDGALAPATWTPDRAAQVIVPGPSGRQGRD